MVSNSESDRSYTKQSRCGRKKTLARLNGSSMAVCDPAWSQSRSRLRLQPLELTHEISQVNTLVLLHLMYTWGGE